MAAWGRGVGTVQINMWHLGHKGFLVNIQQHVLNVQSLTDTLPPQEADRCIRPTLYRQGTHRIEHKNSLGAWCANRGIVKYFRLREGMLRDFYILGIIVFRLR